MVFQHTMLVKKGTNQYKDSLIIEAETTLKCKAHSEAGFFAGNDRAEAEREMLEILDVY